MIARIWRGSTPAHVAEDYCRYLEQTGVAAVRRIEGNRGSLILRRVGRSRAEFVFVSLWDSMDAIGAFAGPDPDRAVYYPRDTEFLLDLPLNVEHYEILSADGRALDGLISTPCEP